MDKFVNITLYRSVGTDIETGRQKFGEWTASIFEALHDLDTNYPLDDFSDMDFQSSTEQKVSRIWYTLNSRVVESSWIYYCVSRSVKTFLLQAEYDFFISRLVELRANDRTEISQKEIDCLENLLKSFEKEPI